MQDVRSRLHRGFRVAVLATLAVFLTFRTFAAVTHVRVKLVDETRTIDRATIVPVSMPADQPVSPPLALIIRASSLQGSRELTVTVDGSVACRLDIGATESRHDCQIAAWSSSASHELTLAADGPAEWTLRSLEVASHHGNTTGIFHFYVLPRNSVSFRGPPAQWMVVILIVMLGLQAVPCHPRSPRIRSTFAVIHGVVLVLIVALIAAPFVTSYLVVCTFGTAVRLCVLALVNDVADGAAWLLGSRRPGTPNCADHRRRLAQAAVMGFIVVLLFGSLVRRQLVSDFQGNYSGFLKIERSFFAENPLVNRDPAIASSLILMDTGYDGELMYFAAFDPFLRQFKDHPEMYGRVVGVPSYRFGRIGFSLLTRWISMGRWQRFPRVMVWSVLISLGACATLLGWLALAIGRSVAAGALVLVIPGFWASLQTALPEPLAAALFLAGFVALYADKPWTAGGLFGASLLVRETGVIAVAALLLWNFSRGNRRAMAITVAFAFLPLLLWRLYLGWMLWPAYGTLAFAYKAPTGIPLAGIATTWELIARGEYWAQVGQMAAAARTFPFLLVGGFVVSLMMVRRAPAIALAGVLYGINALSLDYSSVWGHVANAERTSYELFVMVALGCAVAPILARRERIVLAAFWSSAAVYMIWFTLDAALIRRAVIQQLFLS